MDNQKLSNARLNILLLEDSPKDAELIQAYLSRNFHHEFQMDTVASKSTYFFAISSQKYDLILSDFNLPDINGFTALELVQSVCPLTPFIVISGKIGEETAVELLKQGATDYILKDRLNRLGSSIERAIKEATEIAQLKQKKKDLLESQKIAHLGTWRLDIKTNAVVWTEELYKMYGFDPTLPPPDYREHMKLFTPPSWEKLSSSLALTSSQGVPYELELETVTKDGSNGWMWVRGEAEKDVDGNIVAIWGAAQDISRYKRAEQKIREQSHLAMSLFENMTSGVAIYQVINNGEYGKDYIVRAFNRSALQMENKNEDEVVGKSLFDLRPGIDQYGLIPVFRRVWETGVSEIYPAKLYTDSQFEKFYENRVIRLNTGEVVAFYDDVTDRKIKEEKILYINNHDFLTGLYNRRYYVETFEALQNPDHLPLGIMMFDINGLKILNDAFGHDVGDQALKTVALVLSKTFEAKDVIARIGGDEFAILLPNTTMETMQKYKDALKLSIAKKPIMNVFLSLAIGYEIMMDSKKTLDEMLEMVENHMFRHKLAEGISVRNRAIQAILCTLTEKYEPERIHSERVSQYCRQIGEALELRTDDLKELTLAGMFHDIGKISIPDSILEKPGKLTPEEFAIIKTHTENGYRILRAADQYSDLAIHALCHHERWDGKGYPQGLKGTGIPLYSRIIGVADAFEAMTADRTYKKTITKEKAIEELIKCSGSQFDPDIVKTFIELVLK